MYLFRMIFMAVLTLALMSPGIASLPSSIESGSTLGINSSSMNYQADEDTYMRDVILPAKNANRLTPEMAVYLERYLARLDNIHVPRRDRMNEPDEGGYSFRDDEENFVPNFDWVDISEDGDRLNAGDDWNSGPLDFGWDFEWDFGCGFQLEFLNPRSGTSLERSEISGEASEMVAKQSAKTFNFIPSQDGAC